MNVDRKNSGASVKSLLELAGKAGFTSFSKILTSSLTDEGIKLTLDQFHKGICYRVEKLADSSAIDECLQTILLRRGPSAERFRCLITVMVDSNSGDRKFVEGDYYKVKSRSINGSTDIVLISSGGNIACTSPSYARWGIPSKHIFAVFYDGGMCINMKQHFHPVYHLPFMNDIAVNLVADFTATAYIQNGQAFSTDSTTSWNWAQQTSSDSWELIGLGGAEFSSVAHPTARSISKAPESSIERTKKAINYLVPYINNSLEERKVFFLYYEGVLKRYDHLTATHLKDIDSFSHQRFFNMFRNAERAVMESNAHRRSLGMDALDPTLSAETQPIVLALSTLTVGRGKKRLKPAVEARKKRVMKICK